MIAEQICEVIISVIDTGAAHEPLHRLAHRRLRYAGPGVRALLVEPRPLERARMIGG